jgi:hypothetical protein
MPLGNPQGYARTSRRAPRAFAICDTCGLQYNHDDLVPQMEYQGNDLRPTGFLVCRRTCNDRPQPQLTTPILPRDPQPIDQPRVEQFVDTQTELSSTSYPSSSPIPSSGYPP